MNILLIMILVTILMILAWAIFSNKTETVAEIKPPAEKEQIDEPEKILRRRSADRAIEKEFPVEKTAPDSSSEPYDREDIAAQIQLPFPANEIITDRSRFKLYKRALINSEIYAKRGDIETAVSLFKGVKERILDDDIRSKIESNINYLNHFRHRRDEDFKKRVESSSASQDFQPSELRLRIDGPVPQTINIGMPEKSFINTDEIIDKLSGQISKELGALKGDIDKLKSKPDEKFDLDDYAEFSNLQNEFNNLKKRFEELTDERISTLNELNKLREQREDRRKQDSPENNQLLKDIRKEIDNLSGLKHSLDSLHNKIEDMTSFTIPESETKPKIAQAKFDTLIPDSEPVFDLLDRINEKFDADASEDDIIPEEIEAEDYTDEELETIRDDAELITEQEKEEDLFPEADLPAVEEAGEIHDDVSADDLTILEAEEFLNETEPLADEIIPEKEPLFEEPETKYEEAVEEIFPEAESPADEEDLTAELSDDEIKDFSKDEEAEITESVVEGKKTPLAETREDLVPEEILKTEKEKEIERHTDAEEDPNEFDLLSDLGKIKDDSSLTDEDIFEKILRDEKNKNDDSAFEIIGDVNKDDQEISFNDSILDGKKKAEQDFYKKFIKADRIKKRELPILKVSYDFKKLPDEFSLSREQNILEYSFYKYKPMLEKADEFIKHRHVKDAINYYKVVLDQNIPIEFKAMIKRNIRDLTEYLEKYLSSE